MKVLKRMSISFMSSMASFRWRMGLPNQKCEVHANKVLQGTSYFVHLLRSRFAPMFAQKAQKVSRP